MTTSNLDALLVFFFPSRRPSDTKYISLPFTVDSFFLLASSFTHTRTHTHTHTHSPHSSAVMLMRAERPAIFSLYNRATGCRWQQSPIIKAARESKVLCCQLLTFAATVAGKVKKKSTTCDSVPTLEAFNDLRTLMEFLICPHY